MRRARIRRYRPPDQPALYEICLRTGADGADATGRYADPDLLGHVYVGPYLALAPEFAFVLDSGEGNGGPLGYVLGTPDTVAFDRECERSWWPPLRRRYPDPVAVPPANRTSDQRLMALIHHPWSSPATLTDRFPAHLHIDLLPAAQGQGQGRALLERLFSALADAGATGVHLGVSIGNPRAIGFYRRIGFDEIERVPGALMMGMPL